MELYKWYKGDKLPDRECDCVVIWNARYDSPYDFRETIQKVESLGFVQKTENILGEYVFEFCDSTAGEAIPQEDIIAYMPIEFPKEVE